MSNEPSTPVSELHKLLWPNSVPALQAGSSCHNPFVTGDDVRSALPDPRVNKSAEMAAHYAQIMELAQVVLMNTQACHIVNRGEL